MKTTPQSLADAVRHAEEVRDLHMEPLAELNQRYYGSAYRGKSGGDRGYENHPFEFKSLVVPREAYDNPRFSYKSRRKGKNAAQAKAIAAGMTSAVNQWVEDVDLRETLDELAYDFLDIWACAVVKSEPEPGYDPTDNNLLHRPRVYRIPQEWFFFDPVCLSYRYAAYVGHKYTVGKQELIDHAKENPGEGWDLKAIEGIKSSPDDMHPDPGLRNGADERDTVMVCEIWVPGSTEGKADGAPHPGPAEGYHGTIYTLPVSSGQVETEWLREPYAYYGPACGPYVFGGVYKVRNSPFPLSPLVATKDQQDEVNDATESLNRSARTYKRGVIVDEKNKALAQRIRDFEHDTVLGVPGFDPAQVHAIEIGGITQEQINQREIARDRLNRTSGISDAARGDPTSGVTATADSIADESAQTRMGYIKRQFADLARQIGYLAGHHMYYDNRVVFEIEDETLERVGMPRPPEADLSKPVMFYGGVDESNPDEAEYDYSDLQLTVDVYSMERTSEPQMQRNIVVVMDRVLEAAQLMPQTPYVRWEDVLRDFGDAFNMPNADRWVDRDMLNQIGVPTAQGTPEATLAPPFGLLPAAQPKPGAGMLPSAQKPAMQSAMDRGAMAGAMGRRA